MKRLLDTIALVIAAAIPLSAVAQEWPNRPIRYVIPFQGIPDKLARTYHEKVSQILKQPIVPEFKPGVAGRIALTAIAKADPDGYVIGMAPSGPLVIHPLLYSKLPFDPDKSFAVLGMLGTSPMALAVSAKSGIRTLDDLRNLSGERELNIATGGVGGPQHLAAVLLQRAGVRAELVHYKTSAEVLPSVMNGAIDAYFSTVSQQEIFVKQGHYHAIGVTSDHRMPQLPDVPTFAELGHPEIDIHTFYASVAPAATPQPILDRLTAAYAEAAETPEVRQELKGMALLPMNMPRHELEAAIRAVREKWKRVIDENKIVVE